MGKKTKVGKARKDKYYKLAKEIGYRSRSAFKLLQLNRKFEFLQKSRVLVDLCAAPGGWLQVASKTMPVSGVVIGVDLNPIRPIPRVKTFVADITTEKCRTQLKKELHHWRVDCVLHDGAPNVGTNWLLDAHTQARLTLQSLKLACEFLKKGGWFITKVFRSRDYQSLVWVFHQLFHKVHATKPQASRHESAEIFVVCQGFIAPDKTDPKFFNPKHIFKELPVQESQKKLQILQDPMKTRKAKAVGYEEGELTMHHRVNMSDFLNDEEPVKLLNDCNELVFDVEDIENHRLTTTEIKECAKDIKVLGRKDVRTLLNYHKNMRSVLENAAQLAKETKEAGERERAEAEASHLGNVEIEEINDDDLRTKIEELKEEERKEERKKQKANTRRKQKIQKRLQKLNLMQTATEEDGEGPDRSTHMFKVKQIKDAEHLVEVGEGDQSFLERTEEEEEEEELDRLSGPRKESKYIRQGEVSDPAYPQDEEWGYSDEDDDDDDLPSDLEDEERRLLKKQRNKIREKGEAEDSDSDMDSDSDDDGEKNPLVTDLYDPEERAKRKTNLWFSKDAFRGLEGEDDEDLEISQMSEHYQKMGGSIKEKPVQPITEQEDEAETLKSPSNKKKVSFNTTVFSLDETGTKGEEELSEDEGMFELEGDMPPLGDMLRKGDVDPADESSSSDEDSDLEGSNGRGRRKKRGNSGGPKEWKLSENRRQTNRSTANKDGFEIVSNEPAKEIVKLDPTGLAIGEQIATSKKRRREIIEHGYNRYVYGEEHGLPTWFIRDEKAHCRRLMPVTKEQVEKYKARLREINARPIKKVAEAKARKKIRYMRKVEQLKKKAEAIGDSAEVSEKEKFLKLKALYKRAGLDGKRTKQVTYVVAKKGLQGKRVKRPKGLKGPYKVVDSRMKTDMRGKKAQEARKKKQKKKRH